MLQTESNKVLKIMFLNSAFHIITHYIFQSTYEAMDIFQIVFFKYEFKTTHFF